jgi:3-phosphoshikimate 1-carboxyvinyltransferase
MTDRCIDLSTSDGSVVVHPCREVAGEVHLPGDKSISHRAVLFSLLASGTGTVRGLSSSADVGASIQAVRVLGGQVSSRELESEVLVEGYLEGKAPLSSQVLEEQTAYALVDCQNSGTTMRLLTGILAGRAGSWTLTGDESLSVRPMRRVADPLSAMGARIGLASTGTAPVRIEGAQLRGRAFELPVASAQVKSALLLAGLRATGRTTVKEPGSSRDHTERMLEYMDASISLSTDGCSVESSELQMRDIDIPTDPSAAAFFAAAVSAVGGRIEIPGVSTNPTRSAFFDVLRASGSVIETVGEQVVSNEPRASFVFRSGDRRPVEVDASTIPGAIDEIPLLGVLGALTEGTTRVTGAGELRVKESDRIRVLADGLTRAGVRIETSADGFEVAGKGPPKGGCTLDPEGDHRMAMAFAVLALACQEPIRIRGADCVKVSDPGFWASLDRVGLPRGA